VNPTPTYARFSRRLRALLFDVIVYAVLFYVGAMLDARRRSRRAEYRNRASLEGGHRIGVLGSGVTDAARLTVGM